MTDYTATWTEKFDRWWADNGEPRYGADNHAEFLIGPDEIRVMCRAAFMAGAAAERAEHQAVSDLQASTFVNDRVERAAYYSDDEENTQWGKL